MLTSVSVKSFAFKVSLKNVYRSVFNVFIYGPIVQRLERMTVYHDVAGSNPARVATCDKHNVVNIMTAGKDRHRHHRRYKCMVAV